MILGDIERLFIIFNFIRLLLKWAQFILLIMIPIWVIYMIFWFI